MLMGSCLLLIGRAKQSTGKPAFAVSLAEKFGTQLFISLETAAE